MKKIILVAVATVFATVVCAQKGHYFHANIGGGANYLDYSLADIKQSDADAGNQLRMRYGFNGGVGWQWFFSNHFGVGLGANFNTFGTRSDLHFTQSNAGRTDKENGLSYTEIIKFDNLEEVQKLSAVDIPLSLYYQTPLTERLRLLVGVSGYYSAILSQKYKTVDGRIATGKYFPDYGLDYSGLEDREHGVYSVSDFSGDTKLKNATYGAGADVQLCIALGEKRRVELTIGVYGKHTFPNLRDNNGDAIFDVETAEYKGVTQSNLANDKITSTMFGGTAGIRFRIGGKEKPQQPEEEPQKPEEPEQLVVETDEPQQEIVETEEPQQEIVETDEPKQETPTQIVDTGEKTDDIQPKIVLELPSIPMAFNSVKVAPSAQHLVDAAAEQLKANPSKHVLIIGHTCNIGSAEVNKRIGKQRAEAVKEALVHRGIDASRLTTESRWYEEPVAPNSSDANRQKNRRVELKIVD